MIDPQSKLQFFAVYPTSSIAAHAFEQTDPTEQTVKVTGIADFYADDTHSCQPTSST